MPLIVNVGSNYKNFNDIIGGTYSGVINDAVIPGQTLLIGYLFYQNTKITGIDLQNVTTCGINTFGYAKSITYVNMPNLESVGQFCFDNVNSVTTYNFPKLKVIPKATFAVNSALKTVNLYGITTIQDAAFERCLALTNVNIGSSVTSISSTAFNLCTQTGVTITINRKQDAITGAPWGATNATINWTGAN